MCYRDVGSKNKYVARSVWNVISLRPDDHMGLREKSIALKNIASGERGAVPVVFRCGCIIERRIRKKGNKEDFGVDLVRPTGPGKSKTIKLMGLRDFREFLEGAHKISGDLFGGLSEEIEENGIPKFLEINRKHFADFVADKRRSLEAIQNMNDLGGPLVPGFGRYNYLPIQQGLATNDKRSLQCYASTLINGFMSLGLLNPTLDRKDVEKRYTFLRGEPTSEDGARFAPNDYETLIGVYGKNTLRGYHLLEILGLFQGSDWAKLMGMGTDSAKIKIVDMNTASPETAKDYLDEGWGIQFYAYEDTICTGSDHFITLRSIKLPDSTRSHFELRLTDNLHNSDPGEEILSDCIFRSRLLPGKFKRAFIAERKT